MDYYNNNYNIIYDNNIINDRLIIMGIIDDFIYNPKDLNKIFNIDNTIGNIIHIPMLNEFYIKYLNNNYKINIDNLDLNNYYLDNEHLKILSVKTINNIIFQDILIQTTNNIIIIQIYKFIKSYSNISHGGFIIYNNNNGYSTTNNTIYYIKYLNNNLLYNFETNRKNDDKFNLFIKNY